MEGSFPPRRPSLWEPGFDTAHLAVPVLILLLGGLLFVLPTPRVAPPRPTPAPTPTLQPTMWLSPAPGTTFVTGQTLVVEGLAHPGSVVRLYWYSDPLGDPLIVPPDGRWRFQVANVPAGNHTLRAGALVAGRSVWSSEFTLIVMPPEPVRPKAGNKVQSKSQSSTKAAPKPKPKPTKTSANASKSGKNTTKGE